MLGTTCVPRNAGELQRCCRSVGDLSGAEKLPFFTFWCPERSRGLIDHEPPCGHLSDADVETGLGRTQGGFVSGAASFSLCLRKSSGSAVFANCRRGQDIDSDWRNFKLSHWLETTITASFLLPHTISTACLCG